MLKLLWDPMGGVKNSGKREGKKTAEILTK